MSIVVVHKLIWIAVAGGIGALARYGLSGLVPTSHGGEFPLGTLVVNVVGCFLFGLLWAVLEDKVQVSGEMRAILFAGFLGAFTTFSTFVFETRQLLAESQYALAVVNVAAQNVLGLAALILGYVIGRVI
jgi:CrcB protein